MIVSVGWSYRTSPQRQLDALAMQPTQLDKELAALQTFPEVEEALLLSTCNRTEIYVAGVGPSEAAVKAIIEQMATRVGRPASELSATAALFVGPQAVQHLFSVACGMESMAIGEAQIIAQMKTAIGSAVDAGAVGPTLSHLFDAALRVSKKARTDTAISNAGISLTQAGLDLARTESGGLAGRRALVLGTGVTGRLAARLLREAGVASLTIAGRTPSVTADLAAAVNGTPTVLQDLPALLAESDVLVAAAGAAGPLVPAAHLKSAGSLTVVDLGVPRNVEPSAAQIPGVHLIDVESIGRHLRGQEALHGIDEVRRIVEAETALYVSQSKRREAGPVIAAMHTDIGQLVEVELARLRSRLPELTTAQRLVVEASIHRVIGQFLHKPSLRAKELTAHSSGSRHLHALSELFGSGTHGASPGESKSYATESAA